MLESVPITPEKAKKEAPSKLKVRLDPILPIHVVDVWRLFEKYARDQTYPDLSEEPTEKIQSHLFNYIQSGSFKGLQAKVGKKVVGIILGNIAPRPLGRPQFYLHVECLWVDPAFRGKGIGKALWGDYSNRIKKAGIFNFETPVSDQIAKRFLVKSRATHLITTLGGRL